VQLDDNRQRYKWTEMKQSDCPKLLLRKEGGRVVG
jgi:hypothetical protein